MVYDSLQWALVDGFVDKINHIHLSIVSPYGVICADDIISFWYVQVGHCINLYLSIYLSIGSHY